MAEVRFTREQRQAIDADNRELLISAAAGSGKTAVLVERILRLIQHKHIDMNRMLVVTYTRAAAAELRERLELRLQAAAAEDHSLLKQIDLLAGAQISTIHSYCQKVVKEQFRHCGVDPQFTMADERTSNALYQEALTEVLDAAYAAAKADSDLHALLSALQEKQLITVIDMTYQFLLTRPDPVGWMKAEAARCWTVETLEAHPLCETLLNECSLLLENARVLWQQACELQKLPDFPEKYSTTIGSDYLTIAEMEAACAEGLSALCGKTGKFATIARVKPESTEAAQLAETFKAIRQEYKDCIAALKKVLPASPEKAAADLAGMSPATRGLSWIMEALHETFRS
jgi:ATP-dependent helicase/nuclease subunit A